MQRLSINCGIPARELGNRFDSEDITALEAYSCIEPWGSKENEYLAALICATIANVHSKRHFVPDDFVRKIKRTKPQSKGEIKSQLAKLVRNK